MNRKKPKPAEVPVASPLSYEVLEKSSGSPPGSKMAVLFAHGMGQQRAFDTLHLAAEGLHREAKSKGAEVRQQVRYVKIGSERLYRAEMEFRAKGSTRHVDLYETYWAPLTEGRVNLRDVMQFLLGAGISGIKNSLFPGTQQRFKQEIPLSRAPGTLTRLIVVLAVLFSLIVMNASIVAVGAARSLFSAPSSWLTEPLFQDLSVVFNTLLLFLIPFAAILILASAQKHSARLGTAAVAWITNRLVWISFGVSVLATVWLGIVNLLVLLKHRPGAGLLLQDFPPGLLADLRAAVAALGLFSIATVLAGAVFRGSRYAGGLLLFLLFAACLAGEFLGFVAILSPWKPAWADGMHDVLVGILPTEWAFLRSPLWLWPFLIIIAARLRAVMVQYVGDVAAYISPDRLDRFYELRRRIKENAWKTAAAIYSAKDPGGAGFQYQQIAWAGHSLGSVIAYDTLNRLVKDDEATGNPRDVLGRTNLLLTFGSPLDKISFVFAVRGEGRTPTREAMVSAVQPLIQDYRYRPFPWLNIRSRNDVISGRLDYFDAVPPDPERKVEDMLDHQATTPLVAHTEYWKNSLVWEKLYEKLI